MAELAVTGGYNRGQEGYFAVGLETVDIAPDTATLPAAPALEIVGYANVPSSTRTNGAAKVFAAGTPYVVATRKGRREYAISGALTLGDGAGGNVIAYAAIRNSAGHAGAAKSICLPCLAVGRGAVGACDVTRSKGSINRYGLVGALGLSVTQDGGAMLSYTIPTITSQPSTALTTAKVNHTAIAASGGAPYGWDHLTVNVGGVDISAYLDGATGVNLGINNNVTYKGMRKTLTGGDANPLSRTARALMPGNEDNTLSLGLAAPLPATITDFSTIEIILDNGVFKKQWTLTTNADNGLNEGAVDNGSDFNYTADILAGGVAFTYGASA